MRSNGSSYNTAPHSRNRLSTGVSKVEILFPICLQDEIRRLERDLNTLSYKSSNMSASSQRDRTEAEELRRETWRMEAEVREWMARDARAASSVVAIQDSGRMLAGMETQARSGLDEEVKRTRDQRAQMEGSINRAKLQAREVQDKMMKVEAYAQMKELEEKVRKGRRQLDVRSGNVGGSGVGSKQVLLREDKINWELFKKCVVSTAKARKERKLASEAVAEEVQALDELNMKVARISQEQAAKKKEERRRAELEGSLRLEKVSCEVERMERVVGEMRPQQDERMGTVSKEARVVESSHGEGKELTDGQHYIGKGRELAGQAGECYSQGQMVGMAASQHGSTNDFFSTPTSPPNYVPPTPR